MNGIKFNGVTIRVSEKMIGNDLFRYYVDHYEFPFCGVDHPDEHEGKIIARTYGGTTEMDQDFKHEDVIIWATEVLKNKDENYYKMLFEL